jgi:hypothetical protein
MDPFLLIRAEERRVLFGFWRGQRLRGIEPRLKPGGKYEMATLELVEQNAAGIRDRGRAGEEGGGSQPHLRRSDGSWLACAGQATFFRHSPGHPCTQPQGSTLALAVLLPLIAWRIYARFKRMVGRQRLTKYKLWIQLSLFPALAVLVAVAASSNPKALAAFALSLAGGRAPRQVRAPVDHVRSGPGQSLLHAQRPSGHRPVGSCSSCESPTA